MGMLLAALAGASQAYSALAEQKIRQQSDNILYALRVQAELEKEKRIEEAQKNRRTGR